MKAALAAGVLVAWGALAGCGADGGETSSAAATTTDSSGSGSATPSHAASATPCSLAPTFDYIERITEPGLAPSAFELGNVNLAECKPTLDTFMSTAGQAAGECTTIALASDNPGYDINAADPPPLRKVILSAGPGC